MVHIERATDLTLLNLSARPIVLLNANKMTHAGEIKHVLQQLRQLTNNGQL